VLINSDAYWGTRRYVVMAVLKSIVDIYGVSSYEKRIDIILDRYAIFEHVIRSYEAGIIQDICDESARNRRKGLGSLGVKIQTSGIINMPLNQVIARDEIITAIQNGDYDTALKWTEDPEEFAKELDTIMLMKRDFQLVKSRIGFLMPKEYRLYTRYLEGTVDLFELAREEDISYEACKMRIYRLKSIVKMHCLVAMQKRSSHHAAA
jgi:hypothetical protein